MTSMLSPGRVRRSIRTACAVGAASLAVVAVAGCDKPKPVATVTVGSDSVHSEDVCDNDGKKMSEKQVRDCASKSKPKSIDYSPSDTLRFGVDPEVADKGWGVETRLQNLQTQQEVSLAFVERTKKTYATSTEAVAQQDRQKVSLSVLPETTDVMLVEQDEKGDAYGVWTFRLNKKD